MQTTYTFSQKDLAEIRAVMAKTKRADTPYEERRAVAYAIASCVADRHGVALRWGRAKPGVMDAEIAGAGSRKGLQRAV